MPALRRATLGCLASAAFVAAAGAQSIDFVSTYTGQINGQSLDAAGAGTLDLAQQGNSSGQIDFSTLPTGFDPEVVSLLSNLCSATFRTEGSTENLWTLGAQDYTVQRVFQWVGVPGSFLTFDSTVTSDGELVSASSVLNGNYNGPTGVAGVQSYSVIWIPGSLPGEIFESGTMILDMDNGDELVVAFATVYRGLERSLPGIQVGNGLFNTDFDGSRLTFGWDGNFAVPTPGTAAVLALAGLAATRRRRA
ncbi:MAG: hypothetical protein EA378_04120 [Phycisphaerales bacterium]|nr:MAG: hypothetical protein EA378_04120 [Phycisphaerales bacterium]